MVSEDLPAAWQAGDLQILSNFLDVADLLFADYPAAWISIGVGRAPDRDVDF